MPTKIVPPTPLLDERQRYSVPEALALLRTSRRSFYLLVRAGKVSLIKQGRRSFVSGATIAQLSRAPAQREAAAA